MANIATCPKCAKQLGLPASIAATDRAECPECHAIFSLSETVQISLPVVRVLDPAEQPATAESSSSGEVKKNVTEALASNAAPIKSWEERLKNALALDGSDDEVIPETKVPETKASETTLPEKEVTREPVAPVAKKAMPSQAPSFEFELEPAPPLMVETKPVVRKVKVSGPAKAKTLADFAPPAEASSPGAGLMAKLPEVGLPKVDLQEKVEATVERAATVVHSATEKVEATAQDVVQTVARRRVGRSSLPKIAALATGPVLGGILGLYGLLWVQGEKYDFVGLARVLPASLLPQDFGHAGNPAPGELASAGGAPKSLMAKLQEPPPTEMKHDGEVLPASASEPLLPTTSLVRIDAEEFSALLDAAQAALPEFTAGDLSTPGAIKRKGQAYMAFCRLAEHFDFTKQLGLAPRVQGDVEQARQLYQQAAEQADVRQDFAHIAGRWWEYDKRSSPGIFLIGEVEETLPAGDGTLCWVKPGGDMTAPAIPVWLRHGQYEAGDQIGVVGSVISDAGDLPPGFSGRQAVDANYDFALQ